jgi:hypothetical protein
VSHATQTPGRERSWSVYALNDSRRAIDCPLCGQAARVDLHGRRVSIRCYAGCTEDSVTEELGAEGMAAIEAALSSPRANDSTPHQRLSRALAGVTVSRLRLLRSGRGAQYVLTVIDPRTEEPVDTRPIPADELLATANLQAAIFAVTGRAVRVPRRNGDAWHALMEAIDEASEVIVVADDEADEWRFRIDRYIGDRLGASRDEAAKQAEPFEEGAALYVNRPAFSDHLRQVHRLRVTKNEVSAALHELGFEPDDVFYRDDKGRRRKRCYHRASGWFDGEDGAP